MSDENWNLINNFIKNENLRVSKIKCPICGNNDIKLYAVHPTGNYYICQMYDIILEQRTRVENYFVKSDHQNKDYFK